MLVLSRVVFGALALGVLAVPATPVPVTNPMPADPLAGTIATFDLQLLTREGLLLWSTSEADLDELNQTMSTLGAEFLLPTKFGPRKMKINQWESRTQFTETTYLILPDEMRTMTVGATFDVGVDGVFPGFTSVKKLDRIRGPFDREMSVATPLLANLTTARDGNVVIIDNLFEATVIESSPETTRVRIGLSAGDSFNIRRTPLQARVVDSSAEQFSFRLEARVGDEFSLSSTCQLGRYVLPTGTYRVRSQDDSALSFDYSPTVHPQLMNRDLEATITIVEIVGGGI